VNGVQNLSGQPLSRAPDWTASVGGSYDAPVTDRWTLGLNLSGRYSDGYFTAPNNNPFGWQNAYETLDASVRLYDAKWEIALIGQNLTDTIYATLGGDKPLGQRGDVIATIGRPREVTVQVTRRF
jgi:iron complex outermembrane receptor protein